MIAKPIPVTLRPVEERHAHVVRRLLERGQLVWTAEQVARLEQRIAFVRSQAGLQKAVALILPKKIGEEKGGMVVRYRVLVSGHPHTFIWGNTCQGIISYLGPGEIAPEKEPSA